MNHNNHITPQCRYERCCMELTVNVFKIVFDAHKLILGVDNVLVVSKTGKSDSPWDPAHHLEFEFWVLILVVRDVVFGGGTVGREGSL